MGETPVESEKQMVTPPDDSWMLGTGIDTDMTGDYSGNSEDDRFYLKQGETRELVLLNDGKQSVTIWEHQVQINGSWRNWATCAQCINHPCKLCQYAEKHDKFKRAKVQYQSGIDLTGWQDKKNNWHRNNRCLVGMKKQTVEVMQKRYLRLLEDGKDFRGSKWEVFRSTANQSPGCGSDWTYLKHVDLDDFEVSTEIHDFRTLLAVDLDKIDMFAAKLGFGLTDDEQGITTDQVNYE